MGDKNLHIITFKREKKPEEIIEECTIILSLLQQQEKWRWEELAEITSFSVSTAPFSTPGGFGWVPPCSKNG